MINRNIMSELASFTDAGEHSKFKLLQNWQEYKFTRKAKYSLIVLTKSLQAIADRQFRKYCDDVVSGTSDVLKLLAYNYVVKILNFYLEELAIIKNMLEEYEAYLAAGNWLDFVFNQQRPLDKLWDHRGD